MMKRNKPPLVAHIIYKLGTGGLENGLINIINRTPPGRYRHAIVCLTESGEFANRITVKDVTVVSLHNPPGNSLRIYFNIWKTMRRLSPSIVHTRNLAALEMQPVCALFPGIKRVHGEHGRDIHDLHGKNRKYNLLRKIIQPLVHRYIAVSCDLEQWLTGKVGIPSQKVRQIYNGVDQELFAPQKKMESTPLPVGFLPQGGILIGTVGRLAEVKDQLSLVKAVSLLIEKHPELSKRLRLIVVGDGSMRKTIEGFLNRTENRELVWLAGDREDVPDLLRAMDIFVLPSLGEGISNTILEAMATSLPVIATEVGGNPELIEDGVNGYLVPSGDPEALAARMFNLIDDSNRRKAMGEAGLAKVRERFSWSRTVENYLNVYDGLLEQ